MSAEVSRNNGYVSLMPALRAVLARIRQFQRNRLVALDSHLDQEGLSPHMARDVGLSDASLIYDSRRADRGS
ncbi:conserved hypothetical protein [Bosea sp. 62]|uniref:hypothetical protein n=1 Tax=unclassified Bosea (in: a-proteobacteria) TaxID=2653178 RepID=UPI0012544C69|nr:MULTISPECIES: hypothetical protein [unclassified Bosea (in: a-proteobacteria)]CAD5288447.1 conserved hypothetical protein [Bosea sp. 7B]CAD5300395.1 conserved hypothetical protein [Bosea sp. 21B]CAD5301032.1 conserved hypothetical protein [Bosea sp. 46]VVT62099.1 conserved hypothetical protein [Bosea sp. EC-HK365B]VXB63191.1 conserved hypothetical protein [Bosea sp. 125]